jgi:hypothetical protein
VPPEDHTTVIGRDTLALGMAPPGRECEGSAATATKALPHRAEVEAAHIATLVVIGRKGSPADRKRKRRHSG